MKKLFILNLILFTFLVSSAQTKKPASSKKGPTPKAIVDCLVNSNYYDVYLYKFYSDGTGVVGKSPSFKWKYLGNNVIVVIYNGGFLADDKFKVLNPGKQNCSITKIS